MLRVPQLKATCAPVDKPRCKQSFGHFSLIKRNKKYQDFIHTTRKQDAHSESKADRTLSEITNTMVEVEISKGELQNKVGRLPRKENKAVANNSSSQGVTRPKDARSAYYQHRSPHPTVLI